MTVPKLTVKLQPKTMNTWSEDKLLMPTDLFYSGQDFAKLYHGDFHIATKPVKLSMSVDDSDTDYDFNNENDVSNFCPDVNTGISFLLRCYLSTCSGILLTPKKTHQNIQ